MSTLTIIMGGVAGVFVSGMKAEVDALERFDAQQQARLSLGFLRREVHCASAMTQSGTPEVRGSLTYYPTITLTLPAGCPTGSGQISWCTVSAGTSRWKLYRKAGPSCDSAGRQHADYMTVATPFSYTTSTSTSLGALNVDFPVDKSPSDTRAAYRLQDRLILRNTAYS